MRIVFASFAFVLVVLVGGTAVLANVKVSPPTEKVEQVLPDENFPR